MEYQARSAAYADVQKQKQFGFIGPHRDQRVEYKTKTFVKALQKKCR